MHRIARVRLWLKAFLQLFFSDVAAVGNFFALIAGRDGFIIFLLRLTSFYLKRNKVPLSIKSNLTKRD